MQDRVEPHLSSIMQTMQEAIVEQATSNSPDRAETLMQVRAELRDNHPRLTDVEKDELLGRIWQKTAVEENTLTRHISTLRKALDETYGAWSHNDHPELKRGVDRYVRKQRRGRKVPR